MANVIPILILDPFFPKGLFLLQKKKKKKKERDHLRPFRGLQSQTHSASAAAFDSKEQKEKKRKFRVPFQVGGSNCHSHGVGVK